MKNNIKRIMLIVVMLTLTGCFIDPYKNSKFGEQVIDSWFSYKDGENDLGKTRRIVEEIGTIEERSCDFIEKYKSNYIYRCIITYKELGETAIPFAKNNNLSLYAVFIPGKNKTFTYKVYNSSSEKGIWENDKELK